MNLYRVNGDVINDEMFKSKIINTMMDYKFATLEQLSVILKARKSDISEVLDEIIIAYVKENPTKSYVDVCTDLNVKSDFIEKLIKEGRLEVGDVSLATLKQRENEMAKITNEAVHNMKKRVAISGLQSYVSSVPSEDNSGPHFYTSNYKKR